MLIFVKGLLSLFLTISVFSVFSLKCPKGDRAMSGLANAAVATFLVEAIYKYIAGDFLGIDFLLNTGISAGSYGGIAAAVCVGLTMGSNPVFAVASGVAVSEFGILPGFIAGYGVHFIGRFVEKQFPPWFVVIGGTLVSASSARAIAMVCNPLVDYAIGAVGQSIAIATFQNPLVMGLVLGGLMKIICTSPLSSMALTAMLGLTGLPMGICGVACFGGAFANGVLFHRLQLGTDSQAIAVVMEPLTQADLITKNPVPIYISSFLGGGCAGIIATIFGIQNNAPGTASPIPGMLSSFAFNPWGKVAAALLLSMALGALMGYGVSSAVKKFHWFSQALPPVRS